MNTREALRTALIALILLAPSAVLAFGLIVADAAHGAPQLHGDHRWCVSDEEFRDAPKHITRTNLERRWEVVGLGRTDHERAPARRSLIYPVCGHSIKQAWVVVFYDRTDTTVGLRAMVNLGGGA